MQKFNRIAAAAALAGLAGAAFGQDVFITVENMLPQGSFSFTPVWMGVHDGTFDVYDNGVDADNYPWLEPLAEAGDTMPVMDAFGAAQPGASQTTLDEPNGAPVFTPGQSNSTTLSVGDATVNRWFSFGAMVVPSNDLYIANADPVAHELFDAAGNFQGPVEILIFGRDVNDAGTEINDAFGGAAFSTNGGTSVDEDVPIRDLFTDGGDQDYLDSFIGTMTADGGTITESFGPDDLVGRITIVPAPASLALLGLGSLAALRRRR